MTMPPPDPPSFLDQLIEAERRVTPSPATRAANWTAVSGRLPRSAVSPAATLSGIGKLLGVVLTVGTGVASAALVLGRDSSEAPTAVALEPPRQLAGGAIGDIPDEPPPLPAAHEPLAAPVAADVPKDNGWDAELQRLQQVQAALRAGHADEALALVDDYERRWPRGVFIEEIQAARALAVCAGNDRRASRRALAAFDRTWPQSLYSARVGQGCAEALAPHGARRSPEPADTTP